MRLHSGLYLNLCALYKFSIAVFTSVRVNIHDGQINLNYSTGNLLVLEQLVSLRELEDPHLDA